MFPLQKRFIPITTVTVVLGVIAVIGYLRPAATEAMPNRILFDNAGGHVIFSHAKHADPYQIPCEKCHHESEEPNEQPLQCGTCHVRAFDDVFIDEHQSADMTEENCARCHHVEFTETIFDHEEHFDYGDCTDCHHDEDIEDEPQNCANCHDEEGDEYMPSVKDAVHTSCANCHDDMFDEGLPGCQNCHEMETFDGESVPGYTPCGTCHDQKIEELVPTRMDAFHDGCMSCHEESGKGPYKPDECKQCHMG